MKFIITRLFTLIALILIATSARISAQKAPTEKTAKKELENLQGIWTVVYSEVHGERRSDLEEVKKMRLTIKDDQWTLEYHNNVNDKRVATLTLDPTSSPQAVEFRFTAGLPAGETLSAIYELKGDDLKFCFPDESKKRPKNFDSSEGVAGHWVLALKRERQAPEGLTDPPLKK
jgi:uncharacterized protein (TIGR03067 family)